MSMETRIMTREQLDITIMNGQWFAGFRVKWKQIGTDCFRVKTNYIPAGVR